MDKLKTRFLTHNLINISYIIGSIEEKVKNYNTTQDNSILVDLEVSNVFINELCDDEFISDDFKEEYLKHCQVIREEIETKRINEETIKKTHQLIVDLEKDVTEQIIYIIK